VPPGTHEICPVCFWEDDPVQYEDPDFEEGANVPSLRQARQNYRELGVSEARFREHVRPPTEKERRPEDGP
jgi:hypothetical protein